VALLTVQSIAGVSITPSFSAVSASDTVIPLDDMFYVVRNAGGSADTVTIVIPGNDQFGSAIPDPSVSVPATTGERWLLITPAMADPATGLVTITHGFTTSVTAGVFVR
jgi:hypothetical protein